jgi:hypothetical protein
MITPHVTTLSHPVEPVAVLVGSAAIMFGAGTDSSSVTASSGTRNGTWCCCAPNWLSSTPFFVFHGLAVAALLIGITARSLIRRYPTKDNSRNS